MLAGSFGFEIATGPSAPRNDGNAIILIPSPSGEDLLFSDAEVSRLAVEQELSDGRNPAVALFCVAPCETEQIY